MQVQYILSRLHHAGTVYTQQTPSCRYSIYSADSIMQVQYILSRLHHADAYSTGLQAKYRYLQVCTYSSHYIIKIHTLQKHKNLCQYRFIFSRFHLVGLYSSNTHSTGKYPSGTYSTDTYSIGTYCKYGDMLQTWSASTNYSGTYSVRIHSRLRVPCTTSTGTLQGHFFLTAEVDFSHGSLSSVSWMWQFKSRGERELIFKFEYHRECKANSKQLYAQNSWKFSCHCS